jgi:hypothetical protein
MRGQIARQETYLKLTHILEDFFGVLRHHCGVVHVRFVLKYIPDRLNLTAVSFSTFRRCFWPDVLGVVIVTLVFVLDHRLDLSNGVHEFSWILKDDLLDVHALFVFIFEDWGSEVGNL